MWAPVTVRQQSCTDHELQHLARAAVGLPVTRVTLVRRFAVDHGLDVAFHRWIHDSARKSWNASSLRRHR